MCVIMYKPAGEKMPTTHELKACFSTNPDGAGYMLPLNGKVVIRKGFMTFDEFANDIVDFVKKNKINPVNTPIVCHFRISTQGGVNKALCHPYPISESYEDMRKLTNECDIGLAHNGIISLCTEHSYYGYGHYDKATGKWVREKAKEPNYNDTMTFIKDYASLIIDNDQYFSRSKSKCKLIERLIGYSKLAIMNRKGFVKLIGDFYNRNGIYYSNLHAFPSEDKLSRYYVEDGENL